MNSERDRFNSWIEQGKQLGKSFTFERGGKTFYASVAIQKQSGKYRVVADEIEETLMAAEIFSREDSRIFDSLDEAVSFIEVTTPLLVTDLRPSKGQKWFM
ncbi:MULTISPECIES: hypothetical protein [Sorangium]|uniref:hypothetical protein n=1 Tax=Sorangium TaxID=39643 RepID=UPI003D9C432B